MTTTDNERATCAAKVVYATRTIAKQAAKRTKVQGTKAIGLVGRLRPYQCGVCGLWHLTKSPVRVRDAEYRR